MVLPEGIAAFLSWVAVILSIIATWSLSKYLTNLILLPFVFLQNGRRDAIQLALRVGILYGVATWVIGYLALEASTIIILIAAGGAAVISLSSQGLIATVIAGIMVQSRKIIHKGDFVTIAGMRGEVYEWDFYALSLRTVDGTHVFINWSVVADAIVENDSTTKFTPVEVILPIPITVDIAQAKDIIAGIIMKYQKWVFDRWSKTDLDLYHHLVKRSSIHYPYIVLRSIADDMATYHAFVLVDDQDDRHLDIIHSDILQECVSRLAEAELHPGEGPDETIEVVMSTRTTDEAPPTGFA